MSRCALTFVDDNGKLNPYSPIDDFEQWYAFDPVRAEKTCSVLARIADYVPDASLEDQMNLHEMAVDELVRENVTGYFRKYTDE